MTESAQTSARKRFYILSQDMSRDPSDFEWVNRDEALIDGRSAGRHEHAVAGYRGPICVGPPPLREKPKLVVGERGGSLLDIYGFGTRFVSGRAKDLLSRVDPEGFEFEECETADSAGETIESYWVMDAIRVVNEFDEERSSFVRYVDRNPQSSNPLNPSIVALNDIHWPQDLPETHHAFHLARYSSDFIVDGALADAWRDAGLTGATFTPLQPPTEQEFKGHSSFVNFPYWTEKGPDS